MLQTADPVIDGSPLPNDDADRPTRWTVVLILTLTLFSALTVAGLGAPLLEPMKTELRITDVQIGLLAGLPSLIPMALLSLPIAWMVDHGTRIRLLAVLSVFWGAGTIATAFVTDINTLFIAKLIGSIGSTTAYPVLVSILADVTAPARRGRAMLVISIGAWFGIAASFMIGGTLFGMFERSPGSGLLGLSAWREVYLVSGIAAILLVPPLLFIREPSRFEVERTNVSVWDSLSTIWRRRTFLGPLLVAQLTGGLAEGAAGIWMGSLLTRQYGLSPSSFGAWVGLLIVVSGLLGSVIGGVASDAARKLRMRGGILLPAFIATALTIPAGIFSVMPTASGFAWVLFVLLTGGVVVTLVGSTAITILIPNEERAMTLAGLSMVNKLVMTGLVPPLIGVVAANSGGQWGLGQAIAVLGVVTGFISAVGFWFAMKAAPIEVARDPDAVMVPAAA